MKAKKITTNNYFETIEEIDFENLPPVLKQSHMVIAEKTDNGNDWSEYQNDADLKRMINLAFIKLEDFLRSGNKEELSGTTKSNPKENTPKKNPYSEIAKEVYFIQRFLDFHDKILYKKTFEIFIDELQKAIAEKRITKKSPVAKDIMAMQNAVISAFNTMKNAKHFVLKPTTIKHLKGIIEKYENAYEDIDDSYTKEKRKKMDLNGINQTPQVNVMSSTDFAKLQFDTIGLKGKWLDFIGDPAPGFTVMVFGMPKMGKSYLCVDFAGYLARNHGRVLYAAKEEKLDKTLQDKLNDKNVIHDNLTVADGIPADLSMYDFIFLDSVNKLGLTPKDLEKLKADNKGKSFIYVFQATKGGKFKGNNEFQHDVDVVIEVPEIGKAIQYGRYNQGGEINIFDEHQELAGLEGKEKRYSKHPEIPDISEPYYNDFSRKGWNGVSKDIRKEILKDVPNAEKYLEYEWEDLKPALQQKILDFHFGCRVEKKVPVKKQSSKKKDWTEPSHLNAADHWTLKKIKEYYDEGDMSSAMRTAMNADTIIREEIPGDIWKEMGGKLTATGEEKLKRSRKLLSISIKEISIKTEVGIPLEELAMELIPKGKPSSEIINMIDNEQSFVEKEVQKMVEEYIKDNKLNVKIISLTFNCVTSPKISTGAAYYDVVIEGTKSELKKAAGEGKVFEYEW